MKRKKILVIIPDRILKPMGGMGIGLSYTLKHLEKDFDFSIVGFPEENNLSSYSGVVNPLPSILHGAQATIIGQSAYFSEAIKFEKPDIVHAYDWSTYMAGILTAEHFKVPLVVTMQLSVNILSELGIVFVNNPSAPDGIAIHRTLCEMEILGLKKADKIIQISNAYAERFKALPELGAKTTVISHGIELSEWKDVDVKSVEETRKNLPGRALNKVLYIGRFAAMKGVVELCEARIPNEIDLIFAGENVSEAGIIDRVHKKVNEEKNVHYIGPVYGKEKIKLMKAVDAVIMPSIHEPFGIVGLEALASESVLFSSLRGGLSDYLTPQIAIDCGVTPYSIELAMQKFLVISSKEKKERIERGLEVCKRYDWKVIAEDLKKFYSGI